MSDFLSQYFSTGNPETDRIMTAIERRYMAAKLGDQALDKIWESEDESLDRKQKRLSIMASQKALGLPYSDDDYEKSINEDRPFTQAGVVAAFGKHMASPQVPARGLMETSFPKTTRSAGAMDILLGDGSILRKGARNVSSVAKWFRK
jgi:hypothetical protein